MSFFVDLFSFKGCANVNSKHILEDEQDEHLFKCEVEEVCEDDIFLDVEPIIKKEENRSNTNQKSLKVLKRPTKSGKRIKYTHKKNCCTGKCEKEVGKKRKPPTTYDDGTPLTPVTEMSSSRENTPIKIPRPSI